MELYARTQSLFFLSFIKYFICYFEVLYKIDPLTCDGEHITDHIAI